MRAPAPTQLEPGTSMRSTNIVRKKPRLIYALVYFGNKASLNRILCGDERVPVYIVLEVCGGRGGDDAGLTVRRGFRAGEEGGEQELDE